MTAEDKTILVLTVVNIPLFFLIGKLIFGTWEDFWESVKFWIKPDIWSWLDGEYWQDCWGEAKLFFFGFTCAATLFAEFGLIKHFFFQETVALSLFQHLP